MRLVGAVIAALLVLPGVASAADFNVSTPADGDDKECAEDCTLREAVALAGNNDQINVPKGLYTLQLGELVLVGDHIVGAGARDVFIDGANATRLIRVPDGGGSTLAGVTLRNGNGQSNVQSGFGGAALVLAGATLTLTNSTVSGNDASNGGGIAAIGGGLALIGSTVSGNDASAGRLTLGGGIFSNSTLLLGNTTISGNTAVDTGGGTSSQGGGVAAAGQTLLQNVTIAGNTASTAGGLFMNTPQSGAPQQISNTIIGANKGGSCGGTGLNTDTTRNSIGADTTCLFTGVADRNGFNPLLGGLTNNGGNTDTHALMPTSPAINQGATCAATDQRGVARPQPAGDVCDIGAFEYRAPVLTVVTKVVNNSGGTRAPGAFTVHVREGSADVSGSPGPGTATGTAYTLVAGSSYTTRADAVSGYSLAYSPDCTRTMLEGDVRTCSITADDNAIVKQQQLPPPVPGRNVNALPKAGTVLAKLPGTSKFVLLDEDEQIPLGTIVDVRNGRVTIVAAAGDSQTADFYGGIFKLGQTKGSKPITVVTLVEKLSCPKKKQASAAAKKTKKRRLWGDGKGRFRTKGRHSAATVVGTKWLVEDKCTSTLTRVARGKVRVRDFVKKKTVLVKAGKKYVARKRS